MKHLKFFIAIPIAFISLNLYSQTMITGNVIDEDGKPYYKLYIESGGGFKVGLVEIILTKREFFF